MLNFFKKDPTKKMFKEYELLMKKAIDAQRNGNIELFAELSAKADKLINEIDAIKDAAEKNS